MTCDVGQYPALCMHALLLCCAFALLTLTCQVYACKDKCNPHWRCILCPAWLHGSAGGSPRSHGQGHRCAWLQKNLSSCVIRTSADMLLCLNIWLQSSLGLHTLSNVGDLHDHVIWTQMMAILTNATHKLLRGFFAGPRGHGQGHRCAWPCDPDNAGALQWVWGDHRGRRLFAGVSWGFRCRCMEPCHPTGVSMACTLCT